MFLFSHLDGLPGSLYDCWSEWLLSLMPRWIPDVDESSQKMSDSNSADPDQSTPPVVRYASVIGFKSVHSAKPWIFTGKRIGHVVSPLSPDPSTMSYQSLIIDHRPSPYIHSNQNDRIGSSRDCFERLTE
jgi:hypothetical protein